MNSYNSENNQDFLPGGNLLSHSAGCRNMINDAAVEPPAVLPRPIGMIGSLITTILEVLVIGTGRALVRHFAGEQAAELVTAVLGLSCIVLGFVLFYHA